MSKIPEIHSSMIRDKGLRYSRKWRTLTAVFQDHNQVYQYQGVPEHVVRKVREAESVGAAFNQLIRDKYPFVYLGEYVDDKDAIAPRGGKVGPPNATKEGSDNSRAETERDTDTAC